MDFSNQEVIGELAREVSENFGDVGHRALRVMGDQGKSVSMSSFLD